VKQFLEIKGFSGSSVMTRVALKIH